MKINNDKIIFIPGSVPSLKNSKVKGKNGVFHSKYVNNYLHTFNIRTYNSRKKEVITYKGRINLFYRITHKLKDFLVGVPKPYIIGYHFVRKINDNFDYINSLQIIFDLFVAHSLIEDDNCKVIVPYPIKKGDSYYTVNKNKPGVYIFILSPDEKDI